MELGGALRNTERIDAAIFRHLMTLPSRRLVFFSELVDRWTSVLVGVNVGAYQDSSPAAQNDHEGGKARYVALPDI